MDEKALKVILLEDDNSYGKLIKTKLLEVMPKDSDLVHVTILHELLERLLREKFDVILLDLMVPDSWGIDTFLSVHKDHPHTPIVVLSGINDEYLAVSAVKQGAQDYLVKGKVDEILLMRSIRYSIERKKVEEELRLTNETLQRKLDEKTAEVQELREMLSIEMAARKKLEDSARKS